MTVRKTLLLIASTALAAAVFAIPASASAYEFHYEAEGAKSAAYEGAFEISGAMGGIRCNHLAAEVTYKAEQGNFDSFAPSECALFGPWSGNGSCHLEKDVDVNSIGPIEIVTTESLDFNEVLIEGLTYSSGCPWQPTQFLGQMTASLAEGSDSVDHMDLGGSIQTGFGELSIYGNLDAVAPSGVTTE